MSSTSWTVCSSEGPEKHHGMDWESILNFTPALVRSAPIQVNVICVVKWKTSFCLVGHFRLIVCSLHHIQYLPPLKKCHKSTFKWCHLHCIQSLPTPPADLAYLGQQSCTALVLPHFTLVRRWVGIERHCLLTDFSVNAVSCQCLAPTFPKFFSFTCCPLFKNLNLGRFQRTGPGSAM